MYSKILVALDGSETSSYALEAAILLAAPLRASLDPVYVVSLPIDYSGFPVYDVDSLRDSLLEEGRRLTSDAVKKIKAAGVDSTAQVVETAVLEDVATRIVATAAELEADLVVLGTHGRRGFRRLVLGSVAEHTARLATRPVMLVPNPQADQAGASEGKE
ncbi:universal stress protein [Candidimonas humi]|jgi:nucleotide-binding universal stress UspA family protein|uniref:Universal stress protein n=1 Tax=Candidimonas humi TaxID=683355 RepID=A0ABV8P1D1_9BURK|nr:universal stress protein [Candidimonas humi]MBV6305616.1 universal stress protein [Candidimonas humi]